ncbi:kinase-like domain-containing protein, partial [Gigaspora rosea]
VCLKSLNGSKEDIKREFLNEVENQHKHGGNAIPIYGITKNPDDGNYMMVMQYAKQGSLRKLLDSKYNDLSWVHKIASLYCIANGLAAIHKANLVHKDFHSGNIVNEEMYYSYITDFGLCRPVSQDSSSKEIFGVLPYIAPEVLYGEKYTEKSDIYSFGIIMSEVFTGYPPYHDIPHDFILATQICLGRRPEISYKKTELYKQAEEIKNSGKNSLIHEQVNQTKSTRFNYQTHKQAIYTSRSLNFQKLPKPVNAAISHSIELDEVPDI